MKKPDIKSYSLMAASFLILKGSLHGEIVYVDIEPDIVIDANDDAYLDLNLDGIMDFHFTVHSGRGAVFGGYYSSYTFSSVSRSFRSVRARGLGENDFVAISSTSTSKGDIYHFYGVSPLDSDYLVNQSDSFAEDGYFCHMALKTRLVTAVSHEPIGGWNYFGYISAWNYDELQGEDRYAGVRFTAGEDCMLYGWIRCAVIDSNEQLIIRDYAYDTFCNWGIYTGDTEGGHLSNIDNNVSNATIFANDHTIYIDMVQYSENNHICITDLKGTRIYSSTLQNTKSSIHMSETGIYIVTLNIDGVAMNKKVVIP